MVFLLLKPFFPFVGAGMKTEQSIYGEGVRFKKEDTRSNALEKTTGI